MAGDLIINGLDAYLHWGVRMGEGFLESLFSPPPIKKVIENESRLEHGKQVFLNNLRLDERELTLTFTLEGTSREDYITKYKSFLTEISSGEVVIKVPALGNDVYHMYYLRSTTFAWNIERTFSKISMKLCEPNPANRT